MAGKKKKSTAGASGGNATLSLSDRILEPSVEMRGNPAGLEITPVSNCWEIVQCGHEKQCRVYEERRGRHCYLYDHTFCFGEDMGPFHEKIRICVEECTFYQALRPEIGTVWVQAHQQLVEIQKSQSETTWDEEVLRRRAKQLQEAFAPEDREDRSDLVVFALGNEWFAIETQYVHEIRPISDVTPVPCTPDFVLGITTIRGSVYSVIDIRHSFGSEDRTVTSDTMFIVVNWKNVDLCILVDSVLQKVSIRKSDIKEAGTALRSATSAFVGGVFQLDHRIVTLVNWDAYLLHGNIIIKDGDI